LPYFCIAEIILVVRISGMLNTEQKLVIDGHFFRDMFITATAWLEKSVPEINDLNVFPVPDGDTGTNMYLTMKSSIEEASKHTENDVGSITKALARGALMGARGNSGIILSQIWHGLDLGLRGKGVIGGQDLADAFASAAKAAYEGISNPVEGTILTVMKEVGKACQICAANDSTNAKAVLQVAVESAREAVANTPNQLPVLMEAGVVDSGGHGLYTILEGAFLFATGQTGELEVGKSRMIDKKAGPLDYRTHAHNEKEIPFGYCTEFLLKGESLDTKTIAEDLKNKGESMVVVGDESNVRIHIHTVNPAEIVAYATALGTIHNVGIRNMDEQVADLLAISGDQQVAEVKGVGVIAVVLGDGLSELYTQLGASAIIKGGQTMNPSTRDILEAIDKLPNNDIIILPNNKNVLFVAEASRKLSDKNITVVPTYSMPQGIAALEAFEKDEELEANASYMSDAIVKVRTIEITRATRTVTINGFDIQENQIIGLLDDDLTAAGKSCAEVILDIIGKSDLSETDMITLYTGIDTDMAEAETICDTISKQCKGMDVDIIQGGQPNYYYIISLE